MGAEHPVADVGRGRGERYPQQDHVQGFRDRVEQPQGPGSQPEDQRLHDRPGKTGYREEHPGDFPLTEQARSNPVNGI